DRKVNEDDAALEHLHAQRHVRRRDEQAGDECRPKDLPFGRAHAHRATLSSRSIVSSNRPNRSLALSLPPTVKGRGTTAMPARRSVSTAPTFVILRGSRWT